MAVEAVAAAADRKDKANGRKKNNVLRQLVYHGKKTIPSTLRKDMWVPYFSVHFHDSKVGLRAYHLLREFSMLRQLSPPREMITISERFLDQRRPRDPEQAKEFDEKYAGKLGWLMEKKDRARALMDQKATSVADIAAVLAIQEDEINNGFADGKRGYLTQSARRRRREARKAAEQTATLQSSRIANFEQALSHSSSSSSSNSSSSNNSGSNNSGSNNSGTEYTVEDVERKSPVLQDGKGVKVLWTDLHYAQFAQAWPDRVLHGELDLSRDHVMPGQKPIYDVEVLADGAFKEKQQAVQDKTDS